MAATSRGAALAQVSASVLSADEAHDPDVLSINASSAALACSDIAWAGPVGAVRIAVPSAGAAPIVNATREQAAAAVLSALIVGTEHSILSVEAEVMLDINPLSADGRPCLPSETAQV
jgi:polyribonucleotide nucleotidyltransferase